MDMNLTSTTLRKDFSVTEAVKELDFYLDSLFTEEIPSPISDLKKEWAQFTGQLGSGILRKIS